MEEQKINSKEVKMQSVAAGKQDNQEETQEKLPYDKLKEIADSLWNENRYLKQQLQNASQTLRSINRLDYLFRVAELTSNASAQWKFNAEFVYKCFEEIEKILTLPEEEKEDDVKEA